MEFMEAYGPIIIVWICAGVILNLTVYKDKESLTNYLPEGMGLGMIIGDFLAGPLHLNLALMNCIGFIVGLTIGMSIKRIKD